MPTWNGSTGNRQGIVINGREWTMKSVDYMAVAQKAMDQIPKGAFLTVKAGDALNTMTIGWATMGVVWQRPIFMVAVRNSRHTYGIIEKAADFTVSVPSGDMKDAVMFCGTRSGRDHDKLKECGLKTADAINTISPIINTPGIHFECRIVFKTAMDPAYLNREYDKKLYPEKDYHTLYFGEILDCYTI
jgi:flavin reductase (DIM6/NTAB) family NADH-FMN oxidoreductase RutF